MDNRGSPWDDDIVERVKFVNEYALLPENQLNGRKRLDAKQLAVVLHLIQAEPHPTGLAEHD
jgi:hypothetical protein